MDIGEVSRPATPPAAALFPVAFDRERLDDMLTRELARAIERVARGPVSPVADPQELRRELAALDFNTPQSLERLLPWVIGQLEHGVVHMTHPRYLGLFNPAPSFPAQCADRIAAAFNPQLATATTSPAAVAIEAHVIAAVARRIGLPEGSAGHFTSGGSEANGTALLLALTQANPGFAMDGVCAFGKPPVFYVSADAHLAWIKLAHAAGLGRTAVRLVPTDGGGRMNPVALAHMIEADRAVGRAPVMVAATAGTTNAGMVDPLESCAAIARGAGLWFHVDAAWGGAAAASDRLRPLLAGIEQADSITIDAHKWLATTMGCGMVITRHPLLPSQVFGVATTFMPSHTPLLDPYVTSLQWSRRFNGLRLFLSLAVAGWSGYAQHAERSVELAGALGGALTAHGWRVVNRSSMAVLCLQPPGCERDADVRTVVAKVVASGRAWVSVAQFEGRAVVRACVTHGETSLTDVAEVADALQDAVRQTLDTPAVGQPQVGAVAISDASSWIGGGRVLRVGTGA